MAVGTNIGKIYDGQQGTGFATILEYDPSADVAIAKMDRDEQAEREKARKESLAAAHKKMTEKTPDYWYRHNQEIMEMRNGWLDLGGSMLASGEDPWATTTESGINFRKLADKIDTYSQASMQIKSEWEKIQSAYIDPDKRREVENWDEIVSFYDNPSVVDIVEGKKKMPEPIFKAPEVDTYKMQSDILKQWRGDDKTKILSMDDATLLAAEMQMNDAYSKGFGNKDSKMRQRYKAIESVPELKEAYEARGQSNGGVDGYTQFVAESLYGMTDPSSTLDEFVFNYTKDIQTSSVKIEDGDITRESEKAKITDDQLRKGIRGLLIGKEGYIERDVAAGRYGSPNEGISKKIKAAEDYYFKLAKNNLKSKYSETQDEVKSTKISIEKSRDEWYDAITGKLGEDAQRRAEGQLEGMEIDGMTVTQVFPMDGGVRVNIGDETGQKEQIDIPIKGVPKEDVLSRYDKSLKAGRKPFSIEEREAIPGISDNKIKIEGF